VALDADGDDVLATYGQNDGRGGTAYIGALNFVRLRDRRMFVVGESSDYGDQRQLSGHMSGNCNQVGGWILSSISHGGNRPYPQRSLISLIKLDTSGSRRLESASTRFAGGVYRTALESKPMAWSRSTSESGNTQPRAAVSSDCTKILFNSNWYKNLRHTMVLTEYSQSGEPDEPPVTEDPPSGSLVSYASIETNGLSNGTYPTDDYYLAEYLYQNPDVCAWEQDTQNRTIKPLITPQAPANSINMPLPSGGDDTARLESFFANNAGKSVVGRGTYKVKTLDINRPIDIYNMSMVPASGAYQMVRVNAPDVRIFNSPIDGQNLSSLALGFTVENGAHRFMLVNSGVKNIKHKNNREASAIFIRGANNFQIVCNQFENIFNQTSNNSIVARANSIWMTGRNEHNLVGGLIANNFANNHQSNGRQYDSEFFTIQNYRSVSEDNPVRIFANRAVNAGKRFTKNQEGNALILSNYIEWNTKSGPLGSRKLRAAFSVHFGDNVIVRNNRLNISANGHFDAIFVTDSISAGIVQDNIHFDNNDIELKDRRNPTAGSGPVMLHATVNRAPLQSVGREATNSSAINNYVHGTGSLREYYFFRNGYNDYGGRFEHRNVFLVPYDRNEYRVF